MRWRLFLVLLPAGACIQSARSTAEYINAPVNLSVSTITAGTYELSFYSDNREGGFAGYGVFTGSTAAALNTSPDLMPADISAAQGFCSVAQQAEYRTPVKIQVGAAANGVQNLTALCDLTSLTLTQGSYVAVRARVERTEKPWSAAAIALVP